MNDKIMIQRKLISSICTSIAILLFILGLSTGIYKYIEENNSVKLSATISSINYESKTTYTVKYYVANKEYENNVSLNTKDLAVNDTAMIKVDMRNPKRIITNTLTYLSISLLVISIILSIIFLPSFIKNMKNNKRISLLKKNGLLIKANIKEIYANNRGKQHKKIYPNRLRCSYLNPQDNKEYLFDSEDSFLNFEVVLKEYNCSTISVYVDKVNSTNYYVDLSSLFPSTKLIDPIEFMKEKTQTENKDNSEQVENKEENSSPKEDNSSEKEVQTKDVNKEDNKGN